MVLAVLAAAAAAPAPPRNQHLPLPRPELLRKHPPVEQSGRHPGKRPDILPSTWTWHTSPTTETLTTVIALL